MTTQTALEQEIIESLRRMPEEAQQSVLGYTRHLAGATPPGTPGRELLRFAGMIDATDLEQMKQVIERDCERIDEDDW